MSSLSLASHGPSDRVAGAARTPADPPTYHKMRFQPTPTETIRHLALCATETALQSRPTLTQYTDGTRPIEYQFLPAQKLSEFHV